MKQEELPDEKPNFVRGTGWDEFYWYSPLIKGVYRRRNPVKLKNLAELFNKFRGKERELYVSICEKYNEVPKPISETEPPVEDRMLSSTSPAGPSNQSSHSSMDMKVVPAGKLTPEDQALRDRFDHMRGKARRKPACSSSSSHYSSSSSGSSSGASRRKPWQ